MPLSPAARDRHGGICRLLACLTLWILCLASVTLQPARAGEMRVVASVPPLYFLLAAVMDDAQGHELELLIPSGASPHNYSLRPSDMRKVAGADLVFWVGPALESSLARVLAQPAMQAKTVTLGDAESLHRLRQRRMADGMAAVPHEDGPGDGGPGDGGAADGGAVDPHLWLDPRNAAAILELAAATLSARDPAHAAIYQRNADAALARIKTLDQTLAARLGKVRGKSFITFHDAYQYLEARYGLSNIGFVVAYPEHPAAGARHLRSLRSHARDTKARCLFIEPEYDPALARPVTENSAMRLAVLDHMGARLPLSGESYFVLMEKLATDLADCLTPR